MAAMKPPDSEEGVMNQPTSVMRRPLRVRLPAARITVAIIAAAGLAMPAVVSGAGPSASTVAAGASIARGIALSQLTTVQTALAYARCMRSHGVPKYPDPTTSGALPKESPQQLGVSNEQFQIAARDCQHLLPNVGGGPTPAALQQSWSDFLKFAQCMRRHGVSNWPDPTRYPAHPERPYFDLQRAGIDPNSPSISTRIHACLPLLHGTNPQHLGGGGS
jgi:hypothetical protein